MNEVNNENNVQPEQNLNQVPQQEYNQNVQPVSTIEQQNMGNQVPNQPSNNNNKSNILKTLIICITIILVVAITGLVVFLLNNKPKDTKPNDDKIKQEEKDKNKENKTEDKEVEVSNPESYKYLIDRLGGKTPCGSYNGVAIDEYLKTSQISGGFKLMNAFSNLDEEQIPVNDTDKFYNSSKLSDIGADSGYASGYKAENVEKEIKKIYGKNTIVSYKDVVDTPYDYDMTTKAYFLVGGFGCMGPYTKQAINKVTTKGNELYVYVNAGTLVYLLEENRLESSKIFYDYVDAKDVDTTTIKYVYNTAIDKKYTLKEKRDNEVIESIDYEQYIKDNSDKFAEYKYTFEKEDSNYIIKGLEKIK